MTWVRICDLCRKNITEGNYVSAGVVLNPHTFHVECAPPIVRFLKKITAENAETSSSSKRQRPRRG